MYGKWTKGKAVSTHNSPDRFWETAILNEHGKVVAVVMGASQEESESTARLITQTPMMRQALLAIAEQGGNLSDTSIESVSGVHDGTSRAIMYLNSRMIAQQTLKEIDGE